MNWLRTIRGLVPLLTGLFVVAQFAGVVPFRAAPASPPVYQAPAHAHAGHVHGEIKHKHADGNHSGHEHRSVPGSDCCALHGLTAIVPVLALAVPIGNIGERLTGRRTDEVIGVDARRLDRPPKSLLSL